MGLGFAYAAPDYATRAAAGVTLDPNAADQSAMPPALPPPVAPQAQPQAAPQGSGQPFTPGIWDILQGMIFDKQSPAEAAMAARQRNYQAQTMGIMADALKNASPDQQKAMLLNPSELGKAVASRFQSMALKQGETRDNGEGGPPSVTAPVMGFDPVSGRGYTQTPGSTTATGPSLGGGIEISPLGAANSSRTGPTGQTVSLPQIVAPGSVPNTFTPTVSAPGLPPLAGTSPTASTGPAQPAATPAANVPRGIRNLNFGNLKTPAAGPWSGQTGVDPDGYAVFATPQDGLKAAQQNLQSYAKQGINTLNGIVSTWAPKGDGPNDPVAYAHYLAGKLGVDPNAPLNLADPNVQKDVLGGIFSFENGPAAMAAWRSPKVSGAPAPVAAPVSPGSAPGFAGPAPKTPSILDPNDPANSRAYAGQPPGTVLQRAADGMIAAMPGTGVTYDQRTASKLALEKTDDVTDYRKANTAWGAMLNAAAQPPGGMRAYAMRDTFARLINPGAVARVGTIQALKESQGVPENIRAYLLNLQGDGDVPPATMQQILDVAHGFLLSHYSTAKGLVDSFSQQATRNHIDPREVTPDLPAAPPASFIQGPPAQSQAQRKPGIYATPKGPLEWTGAGWTKPY